MSQDNVKPEEKEEDEKLKESGAETVKVNQEKEDERPGGCCGSCS